MNKQLSQTYLQNLFLSKGATKECIEKFVTAVSNRINMGYRFESTIPLTSVLKDEYSDLANMRIFIFSPGFPNVESIEETFDGGITFWVQEGRKISELTIRVQTLRRLSYWTGPDAYHAWKQALHDLGDIE